MTEMFIGHIANKAYHYTKLGKRKTVQDRDVMSCVINNDELAFLEGMLESEGKWNSYYNCIVLLLITHKLS